MRNPRRVMFDSRSLVDEASTPGQLERMSWLDLSNLRIEDRGAPMHVAALLILERLPVIEADGLSGLAAMRTCVQSRLHLAARLRQVPYQPPPGFGRPVWVDYPGFDIREHVRTRPVGVPGDDSALMRTCAELYEVPLDRSRPLWDMWLLTGLAGGRAALLIRLHHVLADGIAALSMLRALCEPGAGAPDVAGEQAGAPRWVPAPVPALRDLAADRLAEVRSTLAGPFRPAAAGAWLRKMAAQGAALAREGRAPRLSLNAPVSGRRQLTLVRTDLALARTLAHAHGGTVNDAVLAAVAGGARALLGARGELTPTMVARASVAVSLRKGAERLAGGNRVGVFIVPLPVGDPDAGRRLTHIVSATKRCKTRPPYQPSSRLLLGWMIRAMPRQRLVNLLVSNLPGPQEPVWLAGARVLEMLQFGVVQGNVPVSVGALSYAGHLTLGIVADRTVTDLDVFAAGMTQTLAESAGQIGPQR
jgi:diacylglycerol O-acyltransferase